VSLFLFVYCNFAAGKVAVGFEGYFVIRLCFEVHNSVLYLHRTLIIPHKTVFVEGRTHRLNSVPYPVVLSLLLENLAPGVQRLRSP
jgi:hypothetical protein